MSNIQYTHLFRVVYAVFSVFIYTNLAFFYSLCFVSYFNFLFEIEILFSSIVPLYSPTVSTQYLKNVFQNVFSDTSEKNGYLKLVLILTISGGGITGDIDDEPNRVINIRKTLQHILLP